MNYAIHYERLIERARGRILVGYCERHHVLPRCMGGDDSQKNLVSLTAREHYVAHQLLVKIYPQELKLLWAARMLGNFGGRKYEWLKRKAVMALKGKPPSAATRRAVSEANRRRVISEETRRKLATRLGKKHSVETKNKMRIKAIGRKLSSEAKLKISLAHTGRILSEEHKEKIGASSRGTIRGPMSEERKKNISIALRNRYQCQ